MHRFVLLAGLLLGSACAIASGPPPLPSSTLTPEARLEMLLTSKPSPAPNCRVHGVGEPLPSATSFVDSAGLAAELAEASAAPGYAVFALAVDSAGQVEHLEVIDSNLERPEGEALRELVSTRLVQPPAGEPLSVRFRVDRGGRPSIRVGHSETCRPQLLNQDQVRGFMADYSERLPESAFRTGFDHETGRPTYGQKQVVAWYFIDERGRVTDVKIKTRSGHPLIDQLAYEIAPLLRFSRAINNDVPVPVWIALPLTLQI